MHSIIAELRVRPVWKELKHLVISAACEDPVSDARTEAFCRALSNDLGRDCKVVRQTWFFSQLCVPELRVIAAGEAALAHLIIISVHHFETLPDGVKDWIDQWLGQKSRHRLVLLALFDPISRGFSSSMEEYLQEAASRRDMEFRVASEDSCGWR